MRLPLFVLAICFAVDILLDWYLIHRAGIRKGEFSGKWRKILAWAISGVSMAALLVLAIIPRRWADVGILCSMWLLYGWISLLVVKICLLLTGLVSQLLSLIFKRRYFLDIYIGLPVAVIVFLALWWGALYNIRCVERKDVSIVSEKIPATFDGYRIVQFSDIHVGTWGEDTSYVDMLVDSINGMNPDLIVFTGDIVNRQTKELRPFVKSLSRLRARDGVLSILGNHDYGDYISWNSQDEKRRNLEEMYRLQKEMGWRMLDNSHTYIRRGNDSIAVIGVGNWGEPPFSTYGDLPEAMAAGGDTIAMKGDGRFRVLLSHNPEHWRREVAPHTDIDLTLSGHTHAMQFVLSLSDWRWSPSKYKYEQWGGLYWKESGNISLPRIYVNIGCGEVGFPARIGSAYPELTVLTLKSK